MARPCLRLGALEQIGVLGLGPEVRGDQDQQTAERDHEQRGVGVRDDVLQALDPDGVQPGQVRFTAIDIPYLPCVTPLLRWRSERELCDTRVWTGASARTGVIVTVVTLSLEMDYLSTVDKPR